MRKITKLMMFSVIFLFVAKLTFTFVPGLMENEPTLAAAISIIFLALHIIPVIYFMKLRTIIVPEIVKKKVMDLLIIALTFNLVFRILIVGLRLGIMTGNMENFLNNIRLIIPLILFNVFLLFFNGLKKGCSNTRFYELQGISKLNETGFGLLTLLMAIGLVDHLSAGWFHARSIGIFSPLRLLSYALLVFVLIASLKFYSEVVKITDNESI